MSRANYRQINPRALDGLASINKHLASIEPKLRALIELRVSQINGCVYCVDLHASQARAESETQQRLDGLAVWHESQFFDARERAALAWADALTQVASTRAPDRLYDELMPHFTEQQIVDLTLIVSLMNAWNRIGVGFRKQPELRG